MQAMQGCLLTQALVAELRARRIELPPIRDLDVLYAQKTTRAQREVLLFPTEPLISSTEELGDFMNDSGY